MLVTLAGIASLDPGVDAELATDSPATVVEAWVARPDRGADELAERAAAERRVGVRRLLAAREGLGEAAYRRLLDRGHHEVLTALLGNDAVPDAVRADVAAALPGELCARRVTHKAHSRLHRVLGEAPRFADDFGRGLAALANRHERIGLLRGLPDEGLTPAVCDAAAEWLDDELRQRIAAVGPSTKGHVDLTNLCQRVATSPACGEAALARLARLADDHEAEVPDLSRSLRPAMADAARANELAASSDAEALADAIARIGAMNPSESHQAARTTKVVAANRHTPVAALTDALAQRWVSRELRESALKREPLEREVVEAVDAVTGLFHIPEEAVRRCTDPYGAIVTLLGRHADDQRTRRLAAEVGLSGRDLIGALPISQSAWRSLTTDEVDELATKLLDHLGAADADGAWQLFESLAADFDGDLDQLLAACCELSGRPTPDAEAASEPAAESGPPEAPAADDGDPPPAPTAAPSQLTLL